MIIPQVTSDPAADGAAVVPSNTEDLEIVPRCLYVGTGGNVAVVLVSDTDQQLVFKNIPSGSFLPIRPRKVLATGTTATDIVALY